MVVLTSIAVAATAATFSDRFDRFSKVGGVIGTSVSAAFLIILALMNAYILYKLIRQMRRLIRQSPEEEEGAGFTINGAGCLFQCFKKAFILIDRPWKMYPLGFLCEKPFL